MHFISRLLLWSEHTVFGLCVCFIQAKSLKTAHEINKKGIWWIKANATDVNNGLRESMKKEWSEDVDCADGGLKNLHDEYLNITIPNERTRKIQVVAKLTNPMIHFE